MAFPITHLVVAQQLRQQYFPYTDAQKVMLGTSFPDIRYLGEISRDQTHPNTDLNLEQAMLLPDFELGLWVHIRLDKVREEYLTDSGLYDLVPQQKGVYAAAKFIEDTILYPKLDHQADVIGYFNDILEEELQQGCSESAVRQWHQAIAKYISAKPTIETRQSFGIQVGVDPKLAEEKKNWVVEFSNLPEAIKMLESFTAKASSLVSEK